ncbi:hypothetical protein FRB99_006423 [Tulasnella sp. 403]|nr:hypothetical protein FRB99_006423 [Tulasnella sp. 403]
MPPAGTEIELSAPPDDSVSSVKFSPTDENHILVASWDAELRLYDVASNTAKSHFAHKAPVLACCWSDSSHAFSGGLDTWVRAFDLTTETVTVLGAHTAPISSIVCSSANSANTIYTGSWDQTIRVWDSRTPTSTPPAYPLPERVYAMDCSDTTLAVAMAGRLVNIYDLRMMSPAKDAEVVEPTQRRESSLRFMTKTLACMADGKGFAISSVEGRVSVDYFDPSPEAQAQRYAFKCHRQVVNGTDLVWPVNALAFHPTYNTFATGGSDGTVSLWDHAAKKRLKQYPKYPSAVTALDFSHTGEALVIGVSYAWDEGEAGAKKEMEAGGGRVVQVRVRNVSEESKPKAKA